MKEYTYKTPKNATVVFKDKDGEVFTQQVKTLEETKAKMYFTKEDIKSKN